MNKIIKQAFTLIELLVVIAIIGILSGLIVVSMSGVTQKATIAKAQAFSNSLRNSLMLNLIAEYKMDGNVNDSWKSHTAGTVAIATSYSSCVYGTCYNFVAGSGAYLELPDATDLRMTTGGTISVWAYPRSTGGGGAKIVFKGTDIYGLNGYNFRMDDPNRIIFCANAGTCTYTNSKNVIAFNQWNLLTVSFNSSGTKIYINGVDQTDSGGEVNNLPPNVAGVVRIGNAVSSVTYTFDGYIDEVRFYDTAIPTSQIKEQYYAGLNKLLANGEITQENYQKRINNLSLQTYGK